MATPPLRRRSHPWKPQDRTHQLSELRDKLRWNVARICEVVGALVVASGLILSSIDLMNAWLYSMDTAVTIMGVGAIGYGIVQFSISATVAVKNRAAAWRSSGRG